jgi:hypothetical protein
MVAFNRHLTYTERSHNYGLCLCFGFSIGVTRARLSGDHVSWLLQVTARNVARNCGNARACRCLLSATSASLREESARSSETKTALASASETAGANLCRFVYGDEVVLTDDGQLMELFCLSKKVGSDECSTACVNVIGDVNKDKWPITLSAFVDCTEALKGTTTPSSVTSTSPKLMQATRSGNQQTNLDRIRVGVG